MNSYFVGGSDGSYNDVDTILGFDTGTSSWNLVGNMRMKRSYHAVSLVNLEDVSAYCN